MSALLAALGRALHLAQTRQLLQLITVRAMHRGKDLEARLLHFLDTGPPRR